MKRALIIDDDRLMRNLLDEALCDTHKCSLVCDGREGFRLATEFNNYDIITMDLAMPEWDGLSALAMIETMNPTCNVIVISGFISPEDERDLLSFSCVKKILCKPVKMNEFLKVVDEVEGN